MSLFGSPIIRVEEETAAGFDKELEIISLTQPHSVAHTLARARLPHLGALTRFAIALDIGAVAGVPQNRHASSGCNII